MKKWKRKKKELKGYATERLIPARVRGCPFDKGKFLVLVRYRTIEGMRTLGRRAEETVRVHRGSFQEMRDLLDRYDLYQRDWSRYPDPIDRYRIN